MAKIRVVGYSAFLLVWFGQLVSLSGSGLTSFALGVWVYLTTGSTTAFAMVQLFATIPTILLGPVSGALVDRWDRRKAMIISDSGAAFCTLLIMLLVSADKLELWHLYLLLALSASFSTFQWPAYSAAISLLVPKERLGKANGMVQLAEGVAQILAPVTAGVLIGLIFVRGIMIIDIATFLVALLTLSLVRIPKPSSTAAGQQGRGSIVKEMSFGWKYISERKGLLALLMYFAASNFVSSIAVVIFTPLVLGFSTTPVLGLLSSIAGIGFLAGSVLMSTWGGPKRKITGIYIASMVLSLALFVIGLTKNPVLLGIGAFFAFIGSPITSACSQVIWQRKTAPDIQGRVFCYRRVIAFSTIPIAYALAGPLADLVFNPLLVEGGKLAGSLGRIIGVGTGRGIGLMYILLGALLLVATAFAYSYARLRNVEQELPDMSPAVEKQPQ